MLTREKLEERMLSGRPFTYMSLCIELDSSMMGGARIVDRAIQKLRRKGLIAFHREKGVKSPIWQAVEKKS